jgi:hypothetical protein
VSIASHPLLSGKAVDQRGLADVGATDDREVHHGLVVGGRLAILAGPELHHPVEQVAGAEPLRGRDGDRVAQAQGVELRGCGQLARRVDLVGRDHHRHRRAAQELR